MLVVVEDGNVELGLKRAFDRKTFRRADVFQVDAAEGRRDRGNNTHHLLRIVRVDLDVEHIDVGETLEEHALAFHHRLGGQGPAVAQPQNGRPVGHHGYEIALGGVVVGRLGVAFDFEHRLGHAGGIGQGQVALGGDGLGGDHLDLARPTPTVIFERVLARG